MIKNRDQIKYLEECAFKLLKSQEFKGIAVIVLAIALEKKIKNVVIFNYRRSGLSAIFIREHLLKKMGYSELLQELEWAVSFPENKKIKQIWKESKTYIKDLFGVMQTRNLIIHSKKHVSNNKIEENVNDLLFVIDKLAEIFDYHFGYNGLNSLPKTIKVNELNLDSKLFHRSIVKKVNKK